MEGSKRVSHLQFDHVELGGTAYAIVPVAVLLAVCRQGEVRAVPRGVAPPSLLDVVTPDQLEGRGLGRRMAQRRRQAGLTQSELARRAGVRVETVNRIERGRVMPDFGTIRKLVQALQEAETAAGVAVNHET